MEIMAKFLDSSATAFHLEELITLAREHLLLINPQLKFSGRTKELLGAKQGLDVHVIFGKCELHPAEITWLGKFPFIHTHFARALTAKSYLNESLCLITSLDLFDFGQVMNDEMGVLISRESDPELYEAAAAEAQRIMSASEEVCVRVEKPGTVITPVVTTNVQFNGPTSGKLSTHRLAKKLGLKTHELLDGLERLGAIEMAAGQKQLTARGLKLGGERRSSVRFGDYFVWPENFELGEVAAAAP